MVEVPLSIVMLGICTLAVIEAQGTAYKASYFSSEQSTAVTLSQSENMSGSALYRGLIGYVHKMAYDPNAWNYTVTSTTRSSTAPPIWWNTDNNNPPLLSENYTYYTATVTATPLTGDNLTASEIADTDIQKINVLISHTRPDKVQDILDVTSYNINIPR